MKNIKFIGSAFGYGAQIFSTELGPDYMNNKYNIVEKLNNANISSQWYKTVKLQDYDLSAVKDKSKHYNAVFAHNQALFHTIKELIEQHPSEMPLIIGGDHSCAIGTWLGMLDTLDAHEDFGLIWIDAHMDAHITETSPSQSYHGMPLSTLLGYGNNSFHSIHNRIHAYTINPKHMVLIGIRSYEKEEEQFLRNMGVRIITAEEVRNKGLEAAFKEALSIVRQTKKGFGISFDLDGIDPSEAPGVGSPENNGLSWLEIKQHLNILLTDPMLKAMEITEFNPERDQSDKTAEIVFQIALELGKSLNLKKTH